MFKAERIKQAELRIKELERMINHWKDSDIKSMQEKLDIIDGILSKESGRYVA